MSVSLEKLSWCSHDCACMWQERSGRGCLVAVNAPNVPARQGRLTETAAECLAAAQVTCLSVVTMYILQQRSVGAGEVNALAPFALRVRLLI